MKTQTAAIDAFLEEIAVQRRASPHTRRAYRRDLSLLVELAGATPLEQLSTRDIRQAAARLHASGQAPASIARSLSAWRSFYRWLGERGQTTSNPVVGVRAPRRPQRLPKALTVEQAVALVESGGATWLALRDRALAELLYSSGLRLAELTSMDWHYFGAERGQTASVSWLELDAAQAHVTGKGGRQRTVPIGQAALLALRAWLAARRDFAGAARALFVTARGARLSPRSVRTRIAQLARNAALGVHVHPHVLRHSFASHLLQSSGDLRAVQELLGHANIATTQIYTKLDWQHLAKAYDAAHPRARRKR